MEVVFFADDDGIAPALVWLDSLPEKTQNKCIIFLERLEKQGYELRRPDCDYLRDDIYELRIGRQGINYRLLYFFCGERIVVSHGLIKRRKVPSTEIDKAIANRALYINNPDQHTYEG